MTLLEVHELSLLGLFERIAEVERVKESVKQPTEDQSALVASESAAKKELGERLQGATGAGLHGDERQKAKAFLQAQARAVDSADRNGKVRKAKIEELLANVEKAPNMDEPAHVQKARQNVKRVEKGYKEIRETYEKWEKGKARFKTVEELTAMKRQHDDMKKALDAASAFLEEQLRRRRGDGAAPPSATTVATAAPAARPKAKAGPVGPGPAVHTGGRAAAAAGYPAAAPSRPPASAAAMRQATAAAELRRELEEERHAAMAAAAPARQRPAAPRAPKVSAGEPPPAPVLSYSCTCQAVSELCGLSLEEVRALASSSSEFQDHLEEDAWAAVQERSLQIEREKKEEQKEAEKRKQARALAKATELQSATVASGGTPVAKAGAGARPSAASQGGRGGLPEAKAKPRPKGGGANAKPKAANLAGLAHNNRFGGLDDSDDEDDGWTTVKR